MALFPCEIHLQARINFDISNADISLLVVDVLGVVGNVVVVAVVVCCCCSGGGGG